MRVTLYEKDEFPIVYDTDEKRIVICIGACMQCPLFCEYAQTGFDKIDCVKVIQEKLKAIDNNSKI